MHFKHLTQNEDEWETYMKIWETDDPPENVGSSPILFIFSGRNDCAVKLRDHVSSTFINFLINWRWWHSNLWELLYKSFAPTGTRITVLSQRWHCKNRSFNLCRESDLKWTKWRKQPTNHNKSPNGLSPSSAVARPSVDHALAAREHLKETMETTGLPCSVSWVGCSPTSAVEQGWGLVTMIRHQVYQHSPSGLFCLCSFLKNGICMDMWPNQICGCVGKWWYCMHTSKWPQSMRENMVIEHQNQGCTVFGRSFSGSVTSYGFDFEP